MTTTARQERDQVIGTWQGTNVDVTAIEAALTALWKEEGRRESADGRQPPARTSVLNLVVYASTDEDARRAAATLAALSERHPSRTICVVADPQAPTSSLDASVTGRATPADPTRGRLCWEQISITAHGSTARHAPSVVTPLLVPELPTYLWWSGDAPFDAALFERMADLCDRLIIDSGLFSHPIGGLARLAAFAHEQGQIRGVSDFHWMRLTPWRNLIAQFFDAEELRPYAGRIDAVRLGYAHSGSQGNMAQALLLAGWLASCLGWTAHAEAARLDGATLHLEAERTGGVVSIEIEPRAPDGADHGDLVAASITATLRAAPATFSVERQVRDDLATTSTQIDGAPGAAHTVRMARRGPGELLCEELEVFRHDRIYEAAIAGVAALCGQLGTEEQT